VSSNLLIVGAGGHAKVVCDLAKKYYKNIVFADDNQVGKVLGCEIIGNIEKVKSGEKCDFIVAVGNNQVREKLFNEFIELGFTPISLVHPSATIGEDVQIGVGSVVFAGAVINACAKIGVGSIINTMASVDHDCEIGEFNHLAPSCHFAGTVKTGKACFFGIGSSVVNNISVCDQVVVGAGATVIVEIETSGTYIGVPARKIKA